MPTNSGIPIKFLNVDLDVRHTEPLDWLVRYFASRRIHVITHTATDERWLAIFETSPSPETPDECARLLLEGIEQMGKPTREKWDKCSREFNVGYNVGNAPWAFNQALSPGTVHRIASAGAGLRLTLYPQTSSNPSKR